MIDSITPILREMERWDSFTIVSHVFIMPVDKPATSSWNVGSVKEAMIGVVSIAIFQDATLSAAVTPKATCVVSSIGRLAQDSSVVQKM